MFLMGGGAPSEVQDHLQPPANRTTCNYLPMLYATPEMIKEIWKFVHKPRYVDLAELNNAGRTALQVAEANGRDDVATLLRRLAL